MLSMQLSRAVGLLAMLLPLVLVLAAQRQHTHTHTLCLGHYLIQRAEEEAVDCVGSGSAAAGAGSAQTSLEHVWGETRTQQ